jgi:hypothetical protein
LVPIDPERRRNWSDQLTAARPSIAKILGGASQAEAFMARFMAYQDRADTCSYAMLYFVRGMTPPGQRQ